MIWNKLVFRLCFSMSVCLCLFGCTPKESYNIPPKPDVSNTDFVYLDGKNFMIRDSVFQPVMLNYVVEFRDMEDQFVVVPCRMYEDPEQFEYGTKDSNHWQLQGHFKIIKEMGFNSVRVCFDRIQNEQNGRLFYATDGRKYYIDKDFSLIIDGLHTMLECAENAGLKVMLLLRYPIEKKQQEPFTIEILKRFRNNPTLFAYDFMNEPLYFDPEPERKKEDAVNLGCRWLYLMRTHAPNQLYTIGFAEPIEVFEWDANLIPVDFVAFHTYQPMRIPSEVYWYATYLNKPWMLGETGLPADGDSISYRAQKQFLWEVMRLVKDAGGSGFAWWEFQDVPVGVFEHSKLGIINSEGYTSTQDKSFTMRGTIKPAAQLIPLYYKMQAEKKLEKPMNYENMMGYGNVVIEGRVTDAETGKPIPGALIRGWNKWWNVGMNTYSNDEGKFRLYSNDENVHFAISALCYETKTFDRRLAYFDDHGQRVKLLPEILPDQNLEYHDIHFQDYLKNRQVPDSLTDTFMFDYNESEFHRYKYKAKMSEITLKPFPQHR